MTEAEFYKQFKTEGDFWKSKLGKSFKAKYGGILKKAQDGDTNKNGVPDVMEGFYGPYGAQDDFNKQTGPSLNYQFGQQPFVPQNLPQSPAQDYSTGAMNKKYFGKQKPFATGTAGSEWAERNPLPEGINEDLTKGALAGQKRAMSDRETGEMLQTGIGAIDSIVQAGELAKKEEKALGSAIAWEKIAGLSEQASMPDVNARQDIADQAKREREAFMRSVPGEAFHTTYGVGTNVVKSGGKLKAQNGSNVTGMTNMYNTPDDLYTQLGYDPLEDAVFSPFNVGNQKAYASGGVLPKAFWGMTGGMGTAAGASGAGAGAGAGGMSGMESIMGLFGGGQQQKTNPTPQQANAYSAVDSADALLNSSQGVTSSTMYGEGIGQAVGMVNPFLGKVVGMGAKHILNKFNTKPEKTLEAQKNTVKIAQRIGQRNQNLDFLARTGTAEDGGNLTNPRLITHFGEHTMAELLKPDPLMDTLRSGGNLKTNKVGNIETISGGHLEVIGKNPYSDGPASMIHGQSHEESNGKHTGVLMGYDQKAEGGSMEPRVEAQGGEPVTQIGDDAVIFGDLKINKLTVGDDPKFKPFFGMTFQKFATKIFGKNKDLTDKLATNTKKINELDPKTAQDKLTFNSLMMNDDAYNKQLAANDAIIRSSSEYQNIFLGVAENAGTKAGDLSRGKFTPLDKDDVVTSKSGGRLPKAQSSAVVAPTTPPIKFSHQPVKQGNLPYSDIGQLSNPDWATKEKYYDSWRPKVYSAFADPARFTKILNYLYNYKGEGADALKGQMRKLNSQQAIQDFLTTQSTNELIGPIHNMVDEAITATEEVTPSTVAASTTLKPDKNMAVTPYNKTGWETIAGQLMPWLRKPPGEELLGDQLAGEMYALSNNKEEPVQARFYRPQLDVPYDISLQDQLNENQADFNQLTRIAGNNPEALSALAAQKYSANSKVLGEQFRLNQQKKDQVYSQNRQILNEAQRFNIGIADTQYVRQAQAKSATKEVTQAALSSIASKIGQNRLENRTLQTYANMFPDYSYDKNFRIRKTGAPVDWQIDQGIYTTDKEKDITDVPVVDDEGKVIRYRSVSTKPPLATASINKERHGGLIKAFKNI